MTQHAIDQQIAIYQTSDGTTHLDVRLEQDSVWLTQRQMGEVFDTTPENILMHLKNIFRDNELEENATAKDFLVVRAEGNRQVSRKLKHYNLDAIISVGYRVNSKKGTQFRIWANNILKQYLIQGYALNEQKLREQQEKLADLQYAIALSSRLVHNKGLSASESQGILAILEKYSHALTVLDNYDHQRLQIEGTQKAEQAPIRYEEAIAQIRLWRQQEHLGGLFGNEKDDSFKSSLATIYQTFGGEALYPSIAAAIFAWFLQRHDYLYNAHGDKRIADNALVAFTLLIAESKPEEKDAIVKVIINLINGADG